MMRLWVLLAVGSALSLASADAADKKFKYIDLQLNANQRATDNFGRLEGNNLAALPRGEHTFEGIPFKIGDRLLQLGSELFNTKPNHVDGIPVGKTFARLHILHATAFGRSYPTIADDVEIARYEVHYEHEYTETIAVVTAKTCATWYSVDEKGVSRGKVAWKGENQATKNKMAFRRPPEGIRLYLSTWKNPRPGKRVLSIDYVKVGDTPAAPFCVALTLEEK